MDLPRLIEIYKYQDSYPPLHQLVAAYMGIKPKTTKSNNPDKDLGSEIASIFGKDFSGEEGTKKNKLKGIKII